MSAKENYSVLWDRSPKPANMPLSRQGIVWIAVLPIVLIGLSGSKFSVSGKENLLKASKFLSTMSE